MKLLIQRVLHAGVEVDGKKVAAINKGLLVFLGIAADDNIQKLEYCVAKAANLRIFADNNDKMNNSLLDIKGEVLIVPQFTLYGNTAKGRRPGYEAAAPPAKARSFFKEFISRFKNYELKVESGIFGAHMKVTLLNDGPVTFLVEK
ncbi:MAG TPA: D-aminoacyl-tRNA deacylase [Spirochaetota bacterium]|nr:D-aminoacyl-tRNA deacylase [Spirochaetota bacterium]